MKMGEIQRIIRKLIKKSKKFLDNLNLILWGKKDWRI